MTRTVMESYASWNQELPVKLDNKSKHINWNQEFPISSCILLTNHGYFP